MARSTSPGQIPTFLKPVPVRRLSRRKMEEVSTVTRTQIAERASIAARQPSMSPRCAAIGTPTNVEAAQPILTRPRILAFEASQPRYETAAYAASI